jgi:hypothetical protein
MSWSPCSNCWSLRSLLVTSIKPMMSDISFLFGCSDPACTDTGCSSHRALR